MSRLNFSEFEKNYGLKLLPVSLESYKVGNKVEWDNLFHSRFEIEPTFFTKFLGIDKEREKVFAERFNTLHKNPATSASFVALDIEKASHIKSALKIPQLNLDLSGNIDSAKVLKFSYDKIRVRNLNQELL